MMHPVIESILKTICTEYEALPSAAQNQRIYAIKDPREAKMFFDLLVMIGLVAKLYHETSQSKVYVSPPKNAIKSSHELVAEITAYASSARSIKEHLDTLLAQGKLGASDYSLSLSQTPAMDKQITVHLVSENRQVPKDQNNPIALQTQEKPNYKGSVNPGSTSKEDDIFTGPAVMNPIGITRAKLMKVDENPDTLWKQMKLYIKGNALYSSMVFIAYVIALISFFSMFVVSKAFLCPDFASMKDKNPPWYCTYKTDENN
jgi:hypothetical protein